MLVEDSGRVSGGGGIILSCIPKRCVLNWTEVAQDVRIMFIGGGFTHISTNELLTSLFPLVRVK